ncbi:glutamate receptor ionotropic, NMDA 3A-like [Mytilus galloprovincialis]|uniref:glutamate receptor ionotropic, NMDA 3A-like n=1 Tax=Mytilus galloprovincialis TaxID=29158 RepID=UPI003F7BB99B
MNRTQFLIFMFLIHVCGTTRPNVTIAAIFDIEYYDHFSRIFFRYFTENITQEVSLHGIATDSRNNIDGTLRGICSLFKDNNIVSFIVIGSTQTIQSVSLVTTPLKIPVLSYNTDKNVFMPKVSNSLQLQMEPTISQIARGVSKFFSANFWFKFVLLIEKEYISDGFYSEIKLLSSEKKWNITVYFISSSWTCTNICNLIAKIFRNERKIVVLHTKPELAKVIFRCTNYVMNSSISWFLTDKVFTRKRALLKYYPTGALAVTISEQTYLEDILKDSINVVIEAIVNIPKDIRSFSLPVNHNCRTVSSSEQSLGLFFYRKMLEASIEGVSGPMKFSSDGVLQRNTIDVRHLVRKGRKSTWRRIGYVRGDDVCPFGILWPDEPIETHIRNNKKHYRIVTNPVQPFVIKNSEYGLDSDTGQCAMYTTCLELTTKDKIATIKALRDYENGFVNASNPYNISCCRGLTVDLLDKLAEDLNFEYTMYVVQDTEYGKKINGSWTGMVYDLMEGTAHMAIGAFSITRPRLEVIDFTYPYFFSGFSVLYHEKIGYSILHAFLEPFHSYVWYSIFISATISGICSSIFEWNSPFGLNPWGRKRKQNYCLASGLTMVYSLLFGHTVKTKSPKSWPSKVLQNFWACACIFIMASYTANLAAYIAGKHAGINYNDLHDPRLLGIRVGTLGGSAVDTTLSKLNSKLYHVSHRHLVPSSDEGIKMLINNELDAYLGDNPILDYARVKLDPKCRLRLLSQTFGEDGYGIGLPKGSPLKIPLSEKIKEYHENGYIDDLIDIHFKDKQCYKQSISQEDSRLQASHHAGLFVMLSCGLILSILLLFCEHGIFRWLVPYFRNVSETSRWKSPHMLFFSPRLHRIITSAELVSAHESAREMLGIVKNRDFSKLFMKSTIRKNRLAELAKTKRLNRHFLDIVEKAKCLYLSESSDGIASFAQRMQEMKVNNLFGDDSPISATPCITEISLKDLCSQIDFDALKSQALDDYEITEENENEESDDDNNEDDESSSDKQFKKYY